MKRRKLASLLPDRLLVWLHRKLPIGLDPSDGWTAWMDASYLKWCRRDARRRARGDLYEGEQEEVFE